MLLPADPKRVVAEGYDRMGLEVSRWNSKRPPEVRRWFLGEVLARLPEGTSVLELGCGPGTDAAALCAGRNYVGVDLSRVQLSIARQHVARAMFVVGDFTSIGFRPGSFDGVVAFYAFNHVPREELAPTFERIYSWLRRGGRLMTSLLRSEAEDRVEEWLGVPMFFGGSRPGFVERLLREARFHLELSEVREEGVDDGYGPVTSYWVIARKPNDEDEHG